MINNNQTKNSCWVGSFGGSPSGVLYRNKWDSSKNLIHLEENNYLMRQLQQKKRMNGGQNNTTN